jgi:ParB family chromosome partitioning protein
MKTHYLKIVQPYFKECWDSLKTFEVRKNDRDFQKGDIVYLQEYDAEKNTYSGNKLRCTILYVLREFTSLEKGYVVFSFRIDQFIEAAYQEIKDREWESVNGLFIKKEA